MTSVLKEAHGEVAAGKMGEFISPTSFSGRHLGTIL